MAQIRTLKPSVGKLRIPPSKKVRKAQKRAADGRWDNVSEFKVYRRCRVDHPAPTPQPSPCVLWQGRVDKYGYGVITHQGEHKGKLSPKAHRFIMELFLGRRLRPKEFVLHACDNRACFSLLHLSVGTVQDNNRDMLNKGRAKKPPVNRFPGESHPMAKLSEREARKIMALYRAGFTQQTIAERMGISRPQVSRIVRGVNWRASTKDLRATLGTPPNLRGLAGGPSLTPPSTTSKENP